MKLGRLVLLMGGVLAGLFGLLVGGVALSSSAAAPGLSVPGQPGAEPASSEGCPISGRPVLLFYDDFESGAPGWSSVGPGNTWALWSQRVHSGSYAYHAYTPVYPTDQRLTSPPIVLPADQLPITLSFWNYQELEANSVCYDGALVEISADGGASWQQPEERTMIGRYRGRISRGFGNPLGGRQAWCGDPQPWTKYLIDLSSFAGQTIRLRFRVGTDQSVDREGWTVDEVAVEACRDMEEWPWLYVTPPSVAVSQPVGAVSQHQLQINNAGDVAFTWRIVEEPMAAQGAAAVGGASWRSIEGTEGGPGAAAEIIVADGSFEAGTPNPFWGEVSSSRGTPLCSQATCDLPAGAGPHNGEWWAWLGGAPGVAETAVLSQTVPLRFLLSRVRFWLQMPTAQVPSTLTVSLDNHLLFQATHREATRYLGYREVRIDVWDWRGNQPAVLRFNAATAAGARVSGFFVDDVVVETYPSYPCTLFRDVHWVSVSPHQGTLDPRRLGALPGVVPVTLTLSSTGMEPGVYWANLCIYKPFEDDSSPWLVIPVRMEVFRHPNRTHLPLLMRK